ncbi:class I SAM-dependent methyltransferase [Blastochloris tepida]|uniref:Methyltransferase type 11 domain-containing protein n=1 Tax=Blastochloris tepida TaxID=2233851 RepID=A0A348FVM7_9HYPH|nr:class I SAM-dependent methyltransferase [Blastochloris tepida]BBF91360.1 hypothetical protein BLTE_00450 [Blastochloris tepida]
MRYCDLQPAIDAFQRGENVTATLRRLLDSPVNTPQIIEIAYDLQAGSYVDAVRQDEAGWQRKTAEIAGILRPLVAGAASAIEVGTGEMTTLVGVANACYDDATASYACDLSWSRLSVGARFAQERLSPAKRPRLTPFVADLFGLPLRDNAVDVVWTYHALEPNGGREREAARELLRVARRHVVLFEPSFDNNTAEGRARMERLGYVRGLADAVTAEGGIIEGRLMLDYVANPLNPTEALIVRVPGDAAQVDEPWQCPSAGLPMTRLSDCFFSDRSKLAYPIIGGIPILRADAAVMTSAMSF